MPKQSIRLTHVTPGFTDSLGDVPYFACVLVSMCLILFGRFQTTKFAFRW